MTTTRAPWAAAAAIVGLLSACSSSTSGTSGASGASGSPPAAVASATVPTVGPLVTAPPSPAGSTAPAPPTATSAATQEMSSIGSVHGSTDQVIGTVVRFSRGDVSVDVTIDQDTPAVRDFLSMLPLTLDLEELGGREKIATLPRTIVPQDTPGSDPVDGDLIYFTPWGNLGFYYDASGIDWSAQTLHLGTYQATRDELDRLEGVGVTVDIGS